MAHNVSGAVSEVKYDRIERRASRNHKHGRSGVSKLLRRQLHRKIRRAVKAELRDA